MDVQAAYDSVKQHLESYEASVKEKLEQDLPVLGDFLAKAASSPITIAVGNAVHLPDAPELIQKFADEIATVDAALGAAKAQGASEAQAAAAAAAAPAEPAA